MQSNFKSGILLIKKKSSPTSSGSSPLPFSACFLHAFCCDFKLQELHRNSRGERPLMELKERAFAIVTAFQQNRFISTEQCSTGRREGFYINFGGWLGECEMSCLRLSRCELCRLRLSRCELCGGRIVFQLLHAMSFHRKKGGFVFVDSSFQGL